MPEENVTSETEQIKAAEEAKAAEAAAAAAPTFDAAELPPELQGKSAKEISELWDLTRQALSATKLAQDAMRTRLDVPPPPETPPEPKDERSFRDQFEDDPERAMMDWATRSFGGLFEGFAGNSLEGVYAGMKSADPEFEKFEKATRETIDKLGVPKAQITREHVDMAYLMARGRADLDEKKAARSERVEVSTEPPTKQSEVSAPVPLDDTQKEIAKRLGFTDEASYAEYLKRPPGQLADVPTERKDYGTAAKAD